MTRRNNDNQHRFGQFSFKQKPSRLTHLQRHPLLTDQQRLDLIGMERSGGKQEAEAHDSVAILEQSLNNHFQYRPTKPKPLSTSGFVGMLRSLAGQLEKDCEENDDELNPPTFELDDDDDDDYYGSEIYDGSVAPEGEHPASPHAEITFPKQPVTRHLDPSKAKAIQQLMTGHDDGLIYVSYLYLYFLTHDEDGCIRITGEGGPSDIETICDFLEFKKFNATYRMQRTIPSGIRELAQAYEKQATPSQHITTDLFAQTHAVCANDVLRFTRELVANHLFVEFWRTIEYDYTDLANGLPVTFLQPEHTRNVQQEIYWIRPEDFIKRIRSSMDAIDGNDGDKKYQRYLKKLVAEASYLKPRLASPDEIIFDDLRDKFPNFSEVIDFYKAQFRLNTLTGKDAMPPVLLLGSPGIGKTHFAKALAKALNTGYTFIDMASVTAAWVLSGLDSSWNSAKPGKLFNAMLQSPTASPIVLLDEIEKTPKGGHHDATTPLYQCLETANAREFTDEFLDFPVNLSRIIYIACANNLSQLSEPLQTRFRVFHIDTPTGEQHAKVLQSIYDEETADTGIFSPTLDSDVADVLSTLSIREAKVKIVEAVGKALLELTQEEMLVRRKTTDLSIGLDHLTIKPKTARRQAGFH